MKLVTLQQIRLGNILRGIGSIVGEYTLHIRLSNDLQLTVGFDDDLTNIHKFHANRARHILDFVMVDQKLPIVKMSFFRRRPNGNYFLNLADNLFASNRVTNDFFTCV